MTHTTDGPTMSHALTPPGPVPPPIHPPNRSGPPPGPPPPRRRRRTALTAAAAALAVAACGVALTSHHWFHENEFQPVGYTGADPFTAPVGTDQPGLASVPAGGDRSGDSAEMYLQDPAAPACNGAALLGQLRDDPAKAATWAGIQRVTAAQLPGYVQSLTPVLLRADTAVVDHGYRDGTFVPTPAVLAAGTAVFVNSYGQPTVKCLSGDPLTPGSSADPAVTTVTPAPAPITTATFHHPVTGRPVAVPGRPDTTGAGPVPTTGGQDTGSPVPVPPPVTGTFNYDGSITLSDGRIQTVDGTLITPPTPPAGSTALPDGGRRDPDGTFHNRDGSPRDVVPVWGIDGSVDFYLAPDGRVVDRDGSPRPLPPEVSVLRNYDGSVTYAFAERGRVLVVTTSSNGTRGELVRGHHLEGGALVDDVSGRHNLTGTERRQTGLPGGGTLLPDGRNVPAPASGRTDTANPAGHPGDRPANGGVVGPRTLAPEHTTVPLDGGGRTGNDATVEPAPPRNGGVVGPPTDTGAGTPSGDGDDG